MSRIQIVHEPLAALVAMIFNMGAVLATAQTVGVQGSVQAQSYNNVIQADQQAGSDMGAKIAAAVSAATNGIVDARGFNTAQTWSSDVFASSTKPIIVYLPAISISVTHTQTLTTNLTLVCVPATTGSNGTVFTTTINTGNLFSITDSNKITIEGCSFNKTGTAGGVLFSIVGGQNVRMRNLTVNGSWATMLVMNSDSTESTIYNDFEDWIVSGITTSGIVLKASGTSKTTNSNFFRNIQQSGMTGLSAVVLDSSAVSTIGENTFIGGDYSSNSAGVAISTSQARDNMFINATIENNSGTGWSVVAGAINNRCFNCQIAGNGTNVSDSGTNSSILGNTGGVAQEWTVDPSGNLTVNGLCANSGACSPYSSGARATFFVANSGTAQVASNISISGWGTGSAVTNVSGYSQRTMFTVTAGSSPAANPTVTVTFPNSFPITPICVADPNGGTGVQSISPTSSVSSTSAKLTWPGTPVNGLTYVFVVDCRL
jgi:hypothetical protein